MLEVGLVFGLVAMAGASWRAYKGYQGHMKKKKYEQFSWKKFLISVLPAASAAFVAGASVSSSPALLSSEGIVLMMMLFTGGAGIGSLQGKLPFKKQK